MDGPIPYQPGGHIREADINSCQGPDLQERPARGHYTRRYQHHPIPVRCLGKARFPHCQGLLRVPSTGGASTRDGERDRQHDITRSFYTVVLPSMVFLCPGEEPGTLHSLSLQILQMMMVYTISHDSTFDTETDLRWKKLCKLSKGWKKAATMLHPSPICSRFCRRSAAPLIRTN